MRCKGRVRPAGRSFLSADDAARCPVSIAPVWGLQSGDGYAPGGRRVGELSVAQIDAHMANFVGRVEKDQVTGAQFGWGDPIADLDLHGGGAWEPDVEKIPEDPFYEPGAVDTPVIVSTHSVGGACPMAHFDAQALFKGGAGGLRRCRGVCCAGNGFGYHGRRLVNRCGPASVGKEHHHGGNRSRNPGQCSINGIYEFQWSHNISFGTIRVNL